MNYRFIHPLFDERDVDAAMNYMVDIMGASGSIAIQDGDNAAPMDPTIAKAIMKGFIKNSMGNHVVEVANFTLVQDKFYEIYANAYQDFLKYANIDSITTYFTGGAIMLPFVLSRLSNKLDINQIVAYDPDKHWDLLRSRKEPIQDITSPINSYHDVILTINHCTNFDFIDEAFYLSRECDDKAPMLEKFAKREPIDISFRLLPNCDYRIIQRVLKLLHKYF